MGKHSTALTSGNYLHWKNNPMVAWNVIKDCQFSVWSIERCKHGLSYTSYVCMLRPERALDVEE